MKKFKDYSTNRKIIAITSLVLILVILSYSIFVLITNINAESKCKQIYFPDKEYVDACYYKLTCPSHCNYEGKGVFCSKECAFLIQEGAFKNT